MRVTLLLCFLHCGWSLLKPPFWSAHLVAFLQVTEEHGFKQNLFVLFCFFPFTWSIVLPVCWASVLPNATDLLLCDQLPASNNRFFSLSVSSPQPFVFHITPNWNYRSSLKSFLFHLHSFLFWIESIRILSFFLAFLPNKQTC